MIHASQFSAGVLPYRIREMKTPTGSARIDVPADHRYRRSSTFTRLSNPASVSSGGSASSSIFIEVSTTSICIELAASTPSSLRLAALSMFDPSSFSPTIRFSLSLFASPSPSPSPALLTRWLHRPCRTLNLSPRNSLILSTVPTSAFAASRSVPSKRSLLFSLWLSLLLHGLFHGIPAPEFCPWSRANRPRTRSRSSDNNCHHSDITHTRRICCHRLRAVTRGVTVWELLSVPPRCLPLRRRRPRYEESPARTGPIRDALHLILLVSLFPLVLSPASNYFHSHSPLCNFFFLFVFFFFLFLFLGFQLLKLFDVSESPKKKARKYENCRWFDKDNLSLTIYTLNGAIDLITLMLAIFVYVTVTLA